MTDKIEWGGTEGPWRVYEGEYPGIESASHVSIVVYGEEHENEVGIRGTYPYENDRYINARAIAEVPAMVQVLRECAMQFRFYEHSHSAKGTQDGDEKAYRNKQFADKLDAILARIDKGE